jgi:hypothetical protein
MPTYQSSSTTFDEGANCCGTLGKDRYERYTPLTAFTNSQCKQNVLEAVCSECNSHCTFDTGVEYEEAVSSIKRRIEMSDKNVSNSKLTIRWNTSSVSSSPAAFSLEDFEGSVHRY